MLLTFTLKILVSFFCSYNHLIKFCHIIYMLLKYNMIIYGCTMYCHKNDRHDEWSQNLCPRLWGLLHQTCKLLVSFGHLRAVGVHAHPSMGLIKMLNGLLTSVVLIHSYNHCPQSHGFNRSINLLLTFVEFDTLSWCGTKVGLDGDLK